MGGPGGVGSANTGARGRSPLGDAPPVLHLVQPDVLHGWNDPNGWKVEFLRDHSMRLSGPTGVNLLPAGQPAIGQLIAQGLAANPQDALLNNLAAQVGVHPQQLAQGQGQAQQPAPMHPAPQHAAGPPSPQPQTLQEQGQSLHPYTGPALPQTPEGTVTLDPGARQGPRADGGMWTGTAPADPNAPPGSPLSPGSALQRASTEAQGMTPSTKLVLAGVLAAVALAAALAAGAAVYSYQRTRRSP